MNLFAKLFVLAFTFAVVLDLVMVLVWKIKSIGPFAPTPFPGDQ
jgi:hypothetical protein